MHGPGLTATELGEILAELGPRLHDATVRDLARIADRDDLLIFLDTPSERLALHIVTGGRRARVTLTRRRFRKSQFQQGPLVERLRQTLVGARLLSSEAVPGERQCRFHWRRAEGDIDLHVELFGARGFWCLTDARGELLELSRLPNSAGRELVRGARYAPPEPRAEPNTDPPSRFASPILAAVDDHFTTQDRHEEHATLHSRLLQATDRGIRKLEHKVAGLDRQQDQIERVADIRSAGDLLLAYGFGARPDATELEVPDPDKPDAMLTLALTPGVPIQVQAERHYKRARKLEDGATLSASRRAAAAAELTELQELHARVAGLDNPSDIDALADLQTEFYERKLLRRPPKIQARPTNNAGNSQLRKITKGHNVRCFTSEEGLLIMVGRTNQQNDRLSLSIAKGNDCWLHVGRGYAGSHVVIRLPKGKTASLPTLLDAATLAIYFSKARNATRCEVIYTAAKNVRKPKGLPPGKVTTTDTKTLSVDIEADRVRRLLDTAAESTG